MNKSAPVRALALGCCFALFACGDGGTSSSGVQGGSTPTPTATSTPVPTANIIQPTSASTVLSATMLLTTGPGTTNQTTGQTTGGSTSDRSTFETPQLFASYDSQSGYKLTDDANIAIFGTGQLSSSTTSANLYTIASGSTEDYLAIYKGQLDSPNVPRRFAGFGGWQRTLVSSSSRRTRLDYFAYGTATPASSMPHSGVVKFFFVGGGGNYTRDNDLFFSIATGNMTVDFATGTITCDLAVSGSNFYRDEAGGLAGFRVVGPINGNMVENSLESTVAAFAGRFRLMFVGPNAEEAILIYYGQTSGIGGQYAVVGSTAAVRLPS